MATPSQHQITVPFADPKDQDQDGTNWRAFQRWASILPFPRIHRVGDLIPTGESVDLLNQSHTFDLWPVGTEGLYSGEWGTFSMGIELRLIYDPSNPPDTITLTSDDFLFVNDTDTITMRFPEGNNFAASFPLFFQGYREFNYNDALYTPSMEVTDVSSSDPLGGISLTSLSILHTFWPVGLFNTLTKQSMNMGFIAE